MSEPSPASAGQPSPAGARPPKWLMAALALCLGLVLLYCFTHLGGQIGQAAEPTPAPTAEPTPTPAPTPEPTPTPTPTPPPGFQVAGYYTIQTDWASPVPESEAVDQAQWLADAVFIGDSRTDGFRLFSGVTSQATFLENTGLTVFEVMEGKKVIRRGDAKISVLDALKEGTYGKVYIALGVNELGYRDSDAFAETYGQFIDAVRELQPDALLYIQAIIPVNTAKCKANSQPYYVTNEAIAAYNEALAGLCAEKEVFFLRVDEPFLDENGETQADLSADGVHFKKEGYIKWLDYLTTHTGVQQ